MKVPLHSRLQPPEKVSRSICFTPVSTKAFPKSNDLCHIVKVEDETLEDRRGQGAGHLYTSLIKPGDVEVGLDKRLASNWTFLGEKNKIVQAPQDQTSPWQILVGYQHLLSMGLKTRVLCPG